MSRREVLAFGLLGGAAVLGGCAAAGGSSARSSADCVADTARIEALLDRYVAAVNAHDTGPFPGLFTEGYIQHSGRSPSGLAAQIENFKRIFTSMPDVQLKVEDRIISGDKVWARNSYVATHTQPLQGIAPTGRRFTLRTIDIWRVENGKFAEHWDLVDAAGLQRQLSGN